MKTLPAMSKAAKSRTASSKRSRTAFERLSAEFGPSAEPTRTKKVGAVSLLLRLRRGEA